MLGRGFGGVGASGGDVSGVLLLQQAVTLDAQQHFLLQGGLVALLQLLQRGLVLQGDEGQLRAVACGQQPSSLSQQIPAGVRMR